MPTPNSSPHSDPAPTRDSYLARLREMDQDTWSDLDRRFRIMVVNRARQAGLSEADAQDVAQNVFAAMAQNPPGPSPRTGSFRAWIRELTRWRIADRLREVGRQQARHIHREGPESAVNAIDALPADDEFARTWDGELDRHLREVALDRVARQVRPKALQAYQLTEQQGWEPSRVARELGISMATVYVQRFRVRKKLEKIWATLVAEVERSTA